MDGGFQAIFFFFAFTTSTLDPNIKHTFNKVFKRFLVLTYTSIFLSLIYSHIFM